MTQRTLSIFLGVQSPPKARLFSSALRLKMPTKSSPSRGCQVFARQHGSDGLERLRGECDADHRDGNLDTANDRRTGGEWKSAIPRTFSGQRFNKGLHKAI